MPLIIGGAVVLIVALIFGLMQLNRGNNNAGTGTPTGSATASQGTGVGAASATEVVQKYYDALAASTTTPSSRSCVAICDRTFLLRS